MEPLSIAVGLSVGLLLLAALMVYIAHSGEQLGVNSEIGIRTRPTKASPEAWVAGHRAASASLTAGGWVAGSAAVLTIVAGVLVEDASSVGFVGVAGYVASIYCLVVTTRRANRAARAVS
ncbi:SdpI family protein [Isoptericola croceus]|uniref:SdpI family protein n=1 Tax=Isoptericola croceus TaxID=3031406 RepID=UPI0023FA3793|nr:SdpI family protein [Isoptericola croceus]